MADGEISMLEPAPSAYARPAQTRVIGALALAERCDALVVSEHERASCAQMIAAAGRGGAVVAVTAGPGPNTILLPDGGMLEADVPAIEEACDDLGAGDVYAAAFFVALAEGSAPPGRRRVCQRRCRRADAGARCRGDRDAVRHRGTVARRRGLARLEPPPARSASLIRRLSSEVVSSSAWEHARAASRRLPPTGGISTGATCACGRVLVDCSGERLDKHLPGLERTADEPDGKRLLGARGPPARPVMRITARDLRGELPGSPLVELPSNRVASVRELGRLDGKGCDLTLGERL